MAAKLSKPQREVLELLAKTGATLSPYYKSNRADIHGDWETYSGGLTHRPTLKITTMATVRKLEDLDLIQTVYGGNSRGNMVITDKGREAIAK